MKIELPGDHNAVTAWIDSRSIRAVSVVPQSAAAMQGRPRWRDHCNYYPSIFHIGFGIYGLRRWARHHDDYSEQPL